MRLGSSGTRLSVGFGAVCTLLLVVTVRLVQLQGFGFGGYAAVAAAERLHTVPLYAARGSIVDRNGVSLAYTADAKDIVADPSQVTPTDRLTYALKLAPLVGVGTDQIIGALSEPGKYAVVATAIQPGSATQVDALNLPGIYVEPTTQRLYPGGPVGANVIGVLHSDGTPASGIEEQYNTVLSGRNGQYSDQLTSTGVVNPAGFTSRTPAVDGGTVRLTISQDLQYWVQSRLDQAVKQTRSRGGQVVVLDAKTAQVLAMATTSTLDPQVPSTVTPASLTNAAVQTVFEPGSVNKVVTFSAALQNKLITPRTVVKAPDSIYMGGVTVHDAWWHPTEKFTATGVLAESSNVGTLKIAQKVGPKIFDEYLKAYGMGKKTGIELPGETGGILPARKDWSGSTFSNLPIGQGVGMTALQMTSMYQTVANGGVRVLPRIVSSVTNPDGTTVATATPAGTRVISPQTATTLRTMLESVMLPGGTGTKAAIPGYRIAGKTGTAQQIDPKTGKYSADVYWDTFAGFAPADDPRFVVGIMIDNPHGGLFGGDVAAPLFREIATYQLQHDRIAPDGTKSKFVPLTAK